MAMWNTAGFFCNFQEMFCFALGYWILGHTVSDFGLVFSSCSLTKKGSSSQAFFFLFGKMDFGNGNPQFSSFNVIHNYFVDQLCILYMT